jgi:hypothetical protein
MYSYLQVYDGVEVKLQAIVTSSTTEKETKTGA